MASKAPQRTQHLEPWRPSFSSWFSHRAPLQPRAYSFASLGLLLISTGCMLLGGRHHHLLSVCKMLLGEEVESTLSLSAELETPLRGKPRKRHISINREVFHTHPLHSTIRIHLPDSTRFAQPLSCHKPVQAKEKSSICTALKCKLPNRLHHHVCLA